jgi:hypothetical protein
MKATIKLENGKEFEVTLSVDDVQQLEPKKEEWPQQEDIYFHINLYGVVAAVKWDDDSIDEYQKLTNNCFRTEEEAEKNLTRIKNKWAIARRIKELNGEEWVSRCNWFEFYLRDGIDLSYVQDHDSQTVKEFRMKDGGTPERIISEFGEETIKDALFNLS